MSAPRSACSTNPTRAADRYLDVTVRVGDPKLDNFRRVRGERIQFTSGAPVAIDDAAAAARQDHLARNRSRLPRRRRTPYQDQNQSAGQSRRPRHFERFLVRRELRQHWERPPRSLSTPRHWTANVRDLSRDFRSIPIFSPPMFRSLFSPTTATSSTRKARRFSMAAISRASLSPPAPRPKTAWMFPISIPSKRPTRKISPPATSFAPQ